MEQIFALLIPLGCGCVLPIVVIWLGIRQKMNETNQRTKIVLAAIEKNPEMDIEELMKKISPKKKLLKEKLLSNLLWGSIIALFGISILIYALLVDYRGGMDPNDLIRIYFTGGILLAIGIAFLAHYHISKKMLAKEIEAEEKRVTALQA
ncbi:MAG: hypothetical protein IKQ58_05815 [Prevotella sp.]|nr:hypothetical protein [Prevotella sp.]